MQKGQTQLGVLLLWTMQDMTTSSLLKHPFVNVKLFLFQREIHHIVPGSGKKEVASLAKIPSGTKHKDVLLPTNSSPELSVTGNSMFHLVRLSLKLLTGEANWAHIAYVYQGAMTKAGSPVVNLNLGWQTERLSQSRVWQEHPLSIYWKPHIFSMLVILQANNNSSSSNNNNNNAC